MKQENYKKLTEQNRLILTPNFLVKLYKANKKGAPLFIQGPPGIGKSAIVDQACSILGIKKKDIRLSYWDTVDLVGYPMPNKDKKQVEVFTSALFEDITPDWKGIILFDELSGADKNMQQAAYQLFLDRQVNGWKVPEGAMVVAAGNEEDDFAVFNPISSALISRMRLVHVKCDPTTWLAWAVTADVHPAILSYIFKNPGSLFISPVEESVPFPNPRSWVDLGEILKLADDTSIPQQDRLTEEELEILGPGKIGYGLWNEFKLLYDVLSKLEDPEKYLSLEKKLPPFEDPLYYFAVLQTVRTAFTTKKYDKLFRLVKTELDRDGNREEIGLLLNSIAGSLDEKWFTCLDNSGLLDYMKMATKHNFKNVIAGIV